MIIIYLIISLFEIFKKFQRIGGKNYFLLRFLNLLIKSSSFIHDLTDISFLTKICKKDEGYYGCVIVDHLRGKGVG